MSVKRPYSYGVTYLLKQRRQFRKKRVKGQRLPKDNQVAPTPGVDAAPGTETAPGTEAAPVTDAERSAGTAEEDVVNEKLKVEQLWDVDDEFDISVLLAKVLSKKIERIFIFMLLKTWHSLLKDLKKTYRTHGGLKECYRRKRGKQRALNGFSLVVEEGEVFGLLGHNGNLEMHMWKLLMHSFFYVVVIPLRCWEDNSFENTNCGRTSRFRQSKTMRRGNRIQLF